LTTTTVASTFEQEAAKLYNMKKTDAIYIRKGPGGDLPDPTGPIKNIIDYS
jgi:hypothetical protein